jgi:FG-GAP repeat
MGDELGVSVAVDGDTIVAGAPFDAVGADANQGSASVFFAAAPSPGVATTAPPPPPPPDATPVLSKLKVSPSRFRSGSSPSKTARSRAGTKISFALSEAATVKLSFAKAEPGRTVGKACRKPNRANRGKRPCTRYVTVGSFTVQGRSGSNTVAFAGSLSPGKRLAPGSYTLAATPTDGARNTGQTRTAKLRITTRKRVTNSMARGATTDVGALARAGDLP